MAGAISSSRKQKVKENVETATGQQHHKKKKQKKQKHAAPAVLHISFKRIVSVEQQQENALGLSTLRVGILFFYWISLYNITTRYSTPQLLILYVLDYLIFTAVSMLSSNQRHLLPSCSRLLFYIITGLLVL